MEYLTVGKLKEIIRDMPDDVNITVTVADDNNEDCLLQTTYEVVNNYGHIYLRINPEVDLCEHTC